MMANDRNYPLSFHSEQVIPSQTSCSWPSGSCCLCFCSTDLRVLALEHGVAKRISGGSCSVLQDQPWPPHLLQESNLMRPALQSKDPFDMWVSGGKLQRVYDLGKRIWSQSYRRNRGRRSPSPLASIKKILYCHKLQQLSEFSTTCYISLKHRG